MMTRAIFFKSLLTVLGLGQSQKIGSAQMCGSSTGLAIQCECEENEERCPLGHCQKADKLALVEYEFTQGSQFITDKSFSGGTHEKFRVCATCGIVYVRENATTPSS